MDIPKEPSKKSLVNKAEALKFKALKRAYSQKWLTVEVNSWQYNRPDSPLYKPLPNILPLLVPMVVSLLFLITHGIMIGIPLVILSAIFYVLFIKLYWERQVDILVQEALFRSYGGFQFLWNLGGITLKLAYNPGVGCKAPEGDWKNFVVLNLSQLMVAAPRPEVLKMPPPPPPLDQVHRQASPQPSYEDEELLENFEDEDFN